MLAFNMKMFGNKCCHSNEGSLFMAYMFYHIIPVKCSMGVAFPKLGGGGAGVGGVVGELALFSHCQNPKIIID